MDAKILSSIIAAIVSAGVSAGVSFYVSNLKHLRDEEARLNQQILELNKIALQYPYLEDNEFCESWINNKTNKDEKYLRYDNYCCIVFNLMEQIYKLYEGDAKRINYFFSTKEMIIRHRQWWESPSGLFENLDGYIYQFQQYVRSFKKTV